MKCFDGPIWSVVDGVARDEEGAFDGDEQQESTWNWYVHVLGTRSSGPHALCLSFSGSMKDGVWKRVLV